eukprot:TRINITY_DN17359_c0_g1_i2.p1 TRINITY_DN17359_c0_g1~~TRINITY_DN17359_c0_g1_i2.p1  ORF type:complete len:1535 (-),score=523.90 TRINITY_DN17359_c0_g1_i2:108-4712(-)
MAGACGYELFHPKKYESEQDWPQDAEKIAEGFEALLVEGDDQKRSGSDDVQLFLGEVVWAVLEKHLPMARAVELLEKMQLATREALQKIFADVLWLVGFVALEQTKGDMRTDFEALCAAVEKKALLPRPLLALSLETESVPPAVCQVAMLKKKHNQAKTKARYTITRFNLLREHTEGYSKALLLLDRLASLEFHPEAKPEQSKETENCLVEDVIRLAGFCHLCPNRILCMAIDFYERRLQEAEPCPLADALLSLMKRFPQKRLTEVAVFQLLAHPPAAPPAGKRDSTEKPPKGPERPAQFLALASLIQKGLIDVEVLWSYLEPSDSVLAKQHAELMEKYEEAVEKTRTVDLSATSATKDSDRFTKALQAFNQSTHQKFLLVAALISLNCWGPAHQALLNLERVCKPALNDYIRSALCDLMKYLMQPALKPMQKKLPGTEKPGLDTSYRATRRFSFAHAADAPAALEASLQPVAELDSLLPLLKQVLDHLGYLLHTDLHCLTSLWRILLLYVRHKQKDGSGNIDDTIIALIYRHLLPAASLVPHNPYLSDLMWVVIQQLSVFQRFMIYSCWESMYDSFLLKLVYEKTKGATKQILKRVVANAERRDLVAHGSNFHFTKLCHSNPIPAIETMLRDIESGFNVNLIQPYVECTSRCPEMTADIMGYVLTRSCAKPCTGSRTFLNQEDALMASWLLNLGEFVGRFYKKHPTTDLTGLLSVIAKRINSEVPNGSAKGAGGGSQYKGESLIRVVLESMLEHMGGLVTVADLNADQLLCLAGGPRLRGESLSYVTRKEDAARKEKARQALLAPLLELELVPVLWYSLSQQRHHFLSEEFAEAHSGSSGLKLLGMLFDGNHDCFLKITEFLTQALPRDQYRSLLPPLQEVFSAYEPSLAFLLIRHGLTPFGRNTSASSTAAAAAVAASPAAAPAADAAAGAAAESAVATNGNGSIADEPMMVDLEKVVRLFLPTNFEGEGLAMSFYVTFWRLSLQDIFMPQVGYEKAYRQIEDNIKQVQLAKKQLERERDFQDKREYKALKKDIVRLQESSTKLKEEENKQAYAHKLVLARLEQEKKSWFKRPGPPATTNFVAEMLCPRVLTSHADALFCCHFVRLLIRLKTPGFQLLDFYNSWTIMLTQCIRCCSEREAQIFGVFLREMMSYVLHLRQNEKVYNEEMKDNPAFFRHYEDPSTSEVAYAKFGDFAKGHVKWEGRIFKAVRAGLESKDWMEKRNALLLLSQSAKAFPMVEKYSKETLKLVETLKEKETLADLKTLANSIAVLLRSQKENWVDKQPVVEKKSSDDHKDAGKSSSTAAPTSSGRSKNALDADAPRESRSSDKKESSKADGSSKTAADKDEKSSRRESDDRGRESSTKEAKDKNGKSREKSRDRGDGKAGREKESRDGKEKEKDKDKDRGGKDSSRPKESSEKQRSEKESRSEHKSSSTKTSSTSAGASGGDKATSSSSQAAAQKEQSSDRKRGRSDEVPLPERETRQRTVVVDDAGEKRRRTERESEGSQYHASRDHDRRSSGHQSSRHERRDRR